MAKKWKPKDIIKSKLLPIEVATNDYWEANKNDSDPTVADGKKRYFTWDEAMGINVDGWRLPTRAEWMGLCIEFGEKDGDINPSVLAKTLGLGKNGSVHSGSLWYAGVDGYYWSSTAYFNTSYVYYLDVCATSLSPPDYSYYRYYGFSVRLVRDIKEER